MIKQKRLLSLILLLTILLSGLITTGVYAEQENVGNSFKEWDEVHLVDDMKKWTITFNQEINSSTVNDNNIYVKNHLGERVEDTRVIKGADERTIILQPPRNGYSSEYDYTLHIENILSKQDKKLKDNIAMKFFIEDNMVKDEIEYQDDVVKLREVTTSFDNEDYREIIVPLTEFKAKGLDKGSIIIIDPTEKDIYGYAGKIDSYQVEGENVVIRTTEPLFEELFTHLDLKGKQEVSVEQMLNAQLKEGIEAKPYREYDLQTKRYTQGVEYIFGAKDGSIADVGIKYGDFIIKGSIKVENPDIDYDIKTSWGLFSGFKLDSFYLAYTADIVSDLEIEYRKSFSGNLDEKITLFKYPVPLGATGLIVDLSLDVYADGDVRSSGKVEAKLSQKTKITLGARQTRNGNMEWVRNTTKEEPEFISTIETEFKANAEAGISPTMELSFYKIASAGLVGKIGPYLKLDARAKGKGDYTDGYFDGKLYAEAGVAFSSDMYLGAAFGLIAKDYSLGRTEIKIWSYTEEHNAETQGELQSIKFPENIINMETGDSKKLGITGVYENKVTGNIFEALVNSGVEYILNPSNSASIDNAGNIKILTDENREIEVTARYKGKEGKMVVYVEEKNTGNEENDFNGFNIIWLEGYYDILDSLGDFSEGLARITKTEDGEYKSGYVNKTGKIVVPLIYDRAENFSEGLAVVVKDGKLGFIDKDGREVIPLNYYPYYYAYGFSEGLSVIFIDNKYGYINKSNEIIIPPIYEYAGKFSEGLAVVRENGKCGYIDKNGEVVIPFIYNLGNDFSEGLAAVRGDGGWGYIDKKGNVIIPFKYFSAMDFSEGLALVSKRAQYEHGYIDKTGKEVIPFVYTAYSRSFSEGLAAVTKNSLFPIYDYIDKNGNIIISSTYEDLNHAPYVGDFHEGLAVVRKRNDTVIVDKSGNEIASFDNMIVFGFNEGVASVQFFEGGYGRMKLGIMANPLTR